MAEQGDEHPEDELTEAEFRERERQMRIRVHKHMGMTAAVLGLVAVGVALARMRTMFGVSPLVALGIGAGAVPWLLLILAAGVAFSLGTSRLIPWVQSVLKFVSGQKPGKP